MKLEWQGAGGQNIVGYSMAPMLHGEENCKETRAKQNGKDWLGGRLENVCSVYQLSWKGKKKRRRGRNIFWLLLENRSGQAVVGVVIYAAAPPSSSTIGQALCHPPVEYYTRGGQCSAQCKGSMWRKGSAGGSRYGLRPTNGFKNLLRRFSLW